MKRFKDIYYYIFYQYYLFCDTPPFKGDSEWKATSLLSVVEMLVFFTLDFYYITFVNKNAEDYPIYIGTAVLVFGGNVLVFLVNNEWIDYYNKFVDWPAKKNAKLSKIVFIVSCLIVVNFAIALTLFYNIAWTPSKNIK